MRAPRADTAHPVAYGGKTITDSSILQRNRYDLGESREVFKAQNEQLGDCSRSGVYKAPKIDRVICLNILVYVSSTQRHVPRLCGAGKHLEVRRRGAGRSSRCHNASAQRHPREHTGEGARHSRYLPPRAYPRQERNHGRRRQKQCFKQAEIQILDRSDFRWEWITGTSGRTFLRNSGRQLTCGRNELLHLDVVVGRQCVCDSTS